MTNDQLAERIDSVKELIEAKLEPLATREDVLSAINKHSEGCQQRSEWTPKAVQKIVGIAAAAVTGLAGMVYAVIQVFN